MTIELQSTSFRNDANLVGYYRLENTSPEVGTATLTNTGATAFNAAMFNNGADFGENNSTKYLHTANNVGIAGGVCTFNFWTKLQTEIGTSIYTFFEQNNIGNYVGYFVTYLYNSGTLILSFERQRQAVSDDTYSYTVTLGTTDFYMISLGYNGTTVQGYLNGSALGTGVNSSGTGSTGYSASNFSIGAFTIGGGTVLYHSSSIVDDFSIFSRSLSSSELSNLYTGTGGNNFMTTKSKFWGA